MKTSEIKNLIEVEPCNGYSIVKINYGYGYLYQKIYIGINEPNPMRKAKEILSNPIEIIFLRAKSKQI